MKQSSPARCEDPTTDFGVGLEAWGYMPDHQHFNLGCVASEACPKSFSETFEGVQQALNCISLGQSEQVESLLHIIPPKFFTGTSKTSSAVNHICSL